MAAECQTDVLNEKFKDLGLNNANGVENNGVSSVLEYGLPLQAVYRIALSFYKEKEGKAVHFSYEDKLQLVAFSQQILHGPFSEAVSKLPQLGALDVVGRDRRLAWQRLGNLSGDQARSGFVDLLNRLCPLFTTYVEAHRREKEEQQRLSEEHESLQHEENLKKAAEMKQAQEQLEKEETLKRQIQQALNEQTFDQFRNYAEQQYPGDPEKQGVLIRQLQEQHYIQYIQQLQTSQKGEITKDDELDKNKLVDAPSDNQVNNIESDIENFKDQIDSASMWTRADIQEFKQTVSQAEGDGVIRVGHGETVTVRVPTHRNGSRIFWEFATDNYDIGFGVYFEYGTPTTDQVSVHISESDDEDGQDLEDIDEEVVISPADYEAGTVSPDTVSRLLIMEIVPVYRRDCQNEVYAGSHNYPGEGVYLLKFDNSYSLWRSKTLYYRVYYSQ